MTGKRTDVFSQKLKLVRFISDTVVIRPLILHSCLLGVPEGEMKYVSANICRDLPEGCYDVEEGYYDPESKVP